MFEFIGKLLDSILGMLIKGILYLFFIVLIVMLLA